MCANGKKRARIAVIGLVGKTVFMEVPRFHVGGETIHARDIHEEWGGKGFNQAVAAARQGADVTYLGAASEADAAAITAYCAGEGFRAVMCAKPSATAYAAILTDGTGETRVTVYPGATLTAADVPSFAEAIAEADFLLLNNEVPEEVNVAAARLARQSGTRIIFNPAPARTLPDELKAATFLFTPNEFEESGLGDVACEVVTTLGARGCRIRATGLEIPAVKVGKSVDSTGAGDTFNAVLAIRLAEGETLESACRAANAAAGFSVTVRYVLPSLPYRSGFGKETCK